MKVYLVGMMGAGKSTVGRILAQRLNVPFFDSDQMIEQSEGLTVDLIFDIKGEAYFRSLERNWLDATMVLQGVFATGGGLPCFNDNINRMNLMGTSIYLCTTIDVLLDRLKNDSIRPALKGKSALQKANFLTKIMAERHIHYTKCKYIIDCKYSVQDIVEDIISILKSDKND